jgi:hypothetical protein
MLYGRGPTHFETSIQASSGLIRRTPLNRRKWMCVQWALFSWRCKHLVHRGATVYDVGGHHGCMPRRASPTSWLCRKSDPSRGDGAASPRRKPRLTVEPVGHAQGMSNGLDRSGDPLDWLPASAAA